MSTPRRNHTETSYVKRAAKHRNRRFHGENEASESSSSRRPNRKSKRPVNGNKQHSSSSISSQSRLRQSQLVDLVDDVGEAERERVEALEEGRENIADEARLM